MIIKVDNREHELLKQINQLVLFIPSFKQLKVETANLPLGDIIISDETEDKIIIERKCLNDLLASIKDGRYEEQSYRLNGLNHPNHNIYYLIEGDVNRMNRFKDTKMEKMTLYSAMFSLNYFKGFSVMRTFSLEETATFICNTANKLSKSETSGKKPYYENNKIVSNLSNDTSSDLEGGNTENTKNTNVEKEEQIEKDYVNVVKKVKKENITPDNIGEIMLCQIPGISSVTALAIMDKFKSIPNLIHEVQQNEECFKDISYVNAKGQTRKINKTSIVNIVKYLLKK
jgi:crossover junction endonuclease MUS81